MSSNRQLSGRAHGPDKIVAALVLFAIFAGGSLLLSVKLPCADAAITTWGDEEWYHWSYADFNYDFVVDSNDLVEFAADWLSPGYISDEDGPGTDVNRDGVVDSGDFALYANEFGRNAEDEFGDNHGKIKVGIRRGYDLEAAAPEIGARVKVENISTGVLLDDYEIDIIVTNAGLNQGITGFAQVDLDWEVEFFTNRNEIVQWTTGPYYNRVRAPGSGGLTYKVFILYSKGYTGEDPNNLVFEDELIEAASSAYNCNTVNAPMPQNKN